MSTVSLDLRIAYATALQEYLREEGEAALEAAYEIGRRANAEGFGLLEMARLHEQAMAAAVSNGTNPEKARRMSEKGSAFFVESLSPFEMTHRGFLEANLQLRQLNEMLERRAAELARANEELERQVRERRQAEDHLRRAQKMQSLGTLAGGIAHDFNNLLGIIAAHGAVAAMPDVDERRRSESFLAIQTAVRRGTSLVRQLLTFARKTDTDFSPVDVNGVIEELVSMLGETFPKSIAFSLRLAAGLPRITADRDQLVQALLNLCVNARDAMPQGGTLTLATGDMDGEALGQRFSGVRKGRFVQIRVADSGIGMEEETRARVFEPFFTTKEAGKGAGLGLAVAYGIVKAHQGYIDVESEPRRGSTFSIFLPFASEGAAPAVLRESRDGRARAGGGRTVLVIEDEVTLSSAIRSILESEGFRVLVAQDGPEALDLFGAGPVDIVLADLGLPGMSGWEAFLEIRSRRPSVRGIISSGFFDASLKEEMLAKGASALLQKPYTVEEILRKIQEVLDRGPEGR